jgi:hypothetical protein
MHLTNNDEYFGRDAALRRPEFRGTVQNRWNLWLFHAPLQAARTAQRAVPTIICEMHNPNFFYFFGLNSLEKAWIGLNSLNCLNPGLMDWRMNGLACRWINFKPVWWKNGVIRCDFTLIFSMKGWFGVIQPGCLVLTPRCNGAKTRRQQCRPAILNSGFRTLNSSSQYVKEHDAR